ncbi:MAG: 4Fe-4S binding protein [Muribaculaceae bacterium]|nr:4Fe-4S binding protein [Muribaculaceae bacterium]
MKNIRVFRIFLAILFFAASTVYLCIGPDAHPMAVISVKSQINLSLLATTIGATLVWLLITLSFGRIYCSTVCPIGAMTDFFARLGRRLRKKKKPYRWKTRKIWGELCLIGFILSLLLGFLPVGYVLGPWNMTADMAATVRPEAISDTWIDFGYGVSTGIISGIVSFIIVSVWSVMSGRDYCTTVCPLGAALCAIGHSSIMNIEIDPDRCTYCGKCEDVCSAHCIKVTDRLVDNPRCLRCFDCLAVCDEDAIRFQSNRNMPLTPLFQKRTEAK